MGPDTSKQILSNAAAAVVALAALATFFLMLYAGRPWQGSVLSWIGVVAFGAWAISPYALLMFLIRHGRTNRLKSLTLLLLGLALSALALFVYVDALFVHPDPQSGLVFLFVPLYQLVGSAIIIAGVWVVAERLEAA